jgi:hypothetical protein
LFTESRQLFTESLRKLKYKIASLCSPFPRHTPCAQIDYSLFLQSPEAQIPCGNGIGYFERRTERFRFLKWTEHSLKWAECSLKWTECSLKWTECSLKWTECSLKWTECSLKWTATATSHIMCNSS